MPSPSGTYKRKLTAFKDKVSATFDTELSAVINSLVDTHRDAVGPVLAAIAKARDAEYGKACEVHNHYRATSTNIEAHRLCYRRDSVLRLSQMWEACQSAHADARAEARK